MIRKLMTVVATTALFGATPLVAQQHFGIVAGVVSANTTISGDGASVSYDARTGFALGVSMMHHIGKDLDFAPELLYVQKGTEVTEGSSSFGMKISYVELPLLFRANFGTSATRPFVTAGPAIGVKAGCKLKGEDGSTTVTVDCDDADFNVKSVDVGVMFGAGVAAKRFSISVRYDLGLTNIAKDTDPGESAKNRAFLAMVGIAL